MFKLLGELVGVRAYNAGNQITDDSDPRDDIRTASIAFGNLGVNPYFTKTTQVVNYVDGIINNLQSLSGLLNDYYQDSCDDLIRDFKGINPSDYITTKPVLTVTINSKMRNKTAKRVDKFFKKKAYKFQEIENFYIELQDIEESIQESETGVKSSDWHNYAQVGEFFTEEYQRGLTNAIGLERVGRYLSNAEDIINDNIDKEAMMDDDKDTINDVSNITPQSNVNQDSKRVKTTFKLWW
jgi:hypothetical protein